MQVHKWNRIKDTTKKLLIYSHVIPEKDTKNILWKKKSAFLIDAAGKSGNPQIED
jgi:hypothetical protein